MTIDTGVTVGVTDEAPNCDGFASRVESLVKEFGSVAEVARKCGLSETVVRKWRNGVSDPSRSNLVALARAANVSLVWLATGEGEARPESGEGAQLRTGFEDEFALVPRYDVKAAGGGGAIVQSEQVVDHLAFRREWLHREGLKAGKLALIEATGDSMSPTINKGDLVLVALDQVDGNDGVYVLRRGNALRVKRLQHMSDGRLKVMSDNPAYEPELIEPDRVQNIQVLGRVCWVGRNFIA